MKTRLRHVKSTNKELLEIAQDESTTPGQLNEIWHTTLSVKVRKAVASNPNAGELTLRAAARLYMEEVLENPAFELLELFGDDNWIKSISKIYHSPESWVAESRYFYRNDAKSEAFAKAALISPHCSIVVLSAALEFLSVTSLKRTFKHPSTKSKASRILVEAVKAKKLGSLTLEAVLKAYNSALISAEELFCQLKIITIVGSLSCRKSTYTRAFKNLLSQSEIGTPGANDSICAILISSRGSCINWVELDIKEKHLRVISKALVIGLELEKKLASRDKDSSFRPALSGIKSSIKTLASIISRCIWGTMNFEERKLGLEYFYNYVSNLGLKDFEWGDSKRNYSPVQLNQELAYELNKQSIEVKMFYAKNKSLGTWFHMQKSDVKFLILEEVNQHLYDVEGVGELLYKDINLKKIISISDDVLIN